MYVRKLTKLDALRILSNAYYYTLFRGTEPTAAILFDAFHKVRRSLRMDDLTPNYVDYAEEGLNPRGPRWL